MNAFKLNYARMIADFAFNLDENKINFDTDEEKSRALKLVNSMYDYAELLAGDRASELYTDGANGER